METVKKSSKTIKTPLGELIYDQEVLSQGTINFEILPPILPIETKPLPPLVKAIRTLNPKTGNHDLNVYTINFVTNAPPIDFKVYKKPSQSNPHQLDFYISYDRTPKPAYIFNIYQICFTLPNISTSINTVKVYLWDDDPEESRGTETTVQSSVP